MLGFTATQVDAMSLWQFMAQVEGYADANTPEDQKIISLSDADIDDISSMMRNG